MSPKVDAADAQVVSGPDESGLQLQGPGIRLNGLLTAVSIRQRRSQAVPQQVVLRRSKQEVKADMISP